MLNDRDDADNVDYDNESHWWILNELIIREFFYTPFYDWYFTAWGSPLTVRDLSIPSSITVTVSTPFSITLEEKKIIWLRKY